MQYIQRNMYMQEEREMCYRKMHYINKQKYINNSDGMRIQYYVNRECNKCIKF